MRARIPVSACGGIAVDPRFGLDYLASATFALQVMDQWDSVRIAMLLDDFNALAT